jgi:hypothetical protein
MTRQQLGNGEFCDFESGSRHPSDIYFWLNHQNTFEYETIPCTLTKSWTIDATRKKGVVKFGWHLDAIVYLLTTPGFQNALDFPKAPVVNLQTKKKELWLDCPLPTPTSLKSSFLLHFAQSIGSLGFSLQAIEELVCARFVEILVICYSRNLSLLFPNSGFEMLGLELDIAWADSEKQASSHL